jgi:hypothetical protein
MQLTLREIERCKKCHYGYFTGGAHKCLRKIKLIQPTSEEMKGYGFESFCRICDAYTIKEKRYSLNLCSFCKALNTHNYPKTRARREQKTAS